MNLFVAGRRGRARQPRPANQSAKGPGSSVTWGMPSIAADIIAKILGASEENALRILRIGQLHQLLIPRKRH